jgi:hypothetical protein
MGGDDPLQLILSRWIASVFRRYEGVGLNLLIEQCSEILSMTLCKIDLRKDCT